MGIKTTAFEVYTEAWSVIAQEEYITDLDLLNFIVQNKTDI